MKWVFNALGVARADERGKEPKFQAHDLSKDISITYHGLTIILTID